MDYMYALEKRLQWLQWTKSPEAREENKLMPERSFQTYQDILAKGDTFFMNNHFCQLVDLARRTIPDDLKFEDDWMVSPNGFMWLEEPFEIPKPMMSQDPDVKQLDRIASMRIHAIGWERVPENYIAYANKNEKAFIQKTLGAEMIPGAYQFVCFLNYRAFNPSAGPGFGMWSYFVVNPGSVVIDRIHRFETNSVESVGSAEYDPGRVTDMLHEIRWIYTAMHLMSQKLAAKNSQTAQRPTRRRMQKAQAPFVPIVKVITLRRMEQKGVPGPSREVDWQYQWPVSGHWRKQFFPSIGEHRLVFIESYVKGPPEKPMKPPQVIIYKAER